MADVSASLSFSLSDFLDKLLARPDFPRPNRILCLGLGSLESSRIAQFQWLLLADLMQRLQVGRSVVSLARRRRRFVVVVVFTVSDS